MAKQVELSVNNMPIKLDYFVHEYLEKVVGGIIASLHDTGEIENLEMSIDNSEEVEIRLNGADISLKEFPVQIIRSTIEGMITPLKGIEGVINTVEIKISS
jgi:hypothetical protein